MTQTAIQDRFAKSATDAGGRFVRKESEFRDRISTDPDARFPPASGRYHLYVSYACPWAHRTLIARKLLGLEGAVSYDVVDYRMRDDGAWLFTGERGSDADSVHGASDLQEVYHRADPEFGAIGTVPVLWDKEEETIVNNESREIVRMFSTAMADVGEPLFDLLPEGMERDVDAMIDANYETVNNGVYRAGFAKGQDAYDEAVTALFGRLDELEELLGGSRFLLGSEPTEADVCLWPTLARFDMVYLTHFKCNLRRVRDYPNLQRYTMAVYNLPGVAATCDFEHMKRHYYESHRTLNPYGIVPIGPEVDFVQQA